MANNDLGDLIKRDIAANRPAAGIAGRLFYDTTNSKLQRDNGATWDDVAEVSGGAGSDTTAIHVNISGEIAAVTEKTTPVGNDLLIIEDSAASDAKKRLKISNLPGGTDANAIHTNVSGEIVGLTEKTTPVGTDLIVIEDSAASNAKKKVQIVNLPSGGGGASTADHFIVGQGGEGDSDLSNKIVIPGLSGHPDIRVAATNDDEFDTTDTTDPLTGWTTLSSGALSTENMNSDFKSCLHLGMTATATWTVYGIYKACPTIPFVMTAKLNDFYFQGGTTYPRAGIFVAEATPGKIETLHLLYQNNTVNLSLERTWWNTPTSVADYGYYANIPTQVPIYLRIDVHSSTNVDFLVSLGGYDYMVCGTATPWLARNPGFTVGAVGLCLLPGNNGTLTKAVFDWVRFT